MKLYKLNILIVAVIFLVSCDIKQKREAELPDVDMAVEVEEGQLPTFDVDWADVNVGTKTKTVEIPKIVVVMEEEEVEIPYIDIDMPDANGNDGEKMEKTEQNIMIEAEVTDVEHNLEIREIRASGSTLYVISELEEMEKSIGDQKLRVSDQVSINAPELTVKYFIVGKRPDRIFNSRYKYYNTMEEAVSATTNSKTIYSNS